MYEGRKGKDEGWLIVVLQLAIANAARLFDAKALGLVNLVVAI